jgi:TRAP-type C4-dicarboxylate transport system permease small subunit
MQRVVSSRNRRGITVLALLLIIIAVIVAAVFLMRYLRQPA